MKCFCCIKDSSDKVYFNLNNIAIITFESDDSSSCIQYKDIKENIILTESFQTLNEGRTRFKELTLNLIAKQDVFFSEAYGSLYILTAFPRIIVSESTLELVVDSENRYTFTLSPQHKEFIEQSLIKLTV